MKNHTIEGYEAYLAGENPTNCPYAQYTNSQRLWDEGWRLAEKHVEEHAKTLTRQQKEIADLRGRLTGSRNMLNNASQQYEKLWQQAYRASRTHLTRCIGCALCGVSIGLAIANVIHSL